MGKTGPVKGDASQASWSEWQPVAGLPWVSETALAEILDGGQSFRWYPLAAEESGDPAAGRTWLGTWGDIVVRLRAGTTTVDWSAPRALAALAGTALAKYFGTGVDFERWTDSLPWRSDAHLARCIEAYRGLRILKQPFGETLLGFLCSATKQIVQIKQMVALLAERHGAPIARAEQLPAGLPGGARYRIPNWAELAELPESELRKCLLGFRARYISETARFLARHPAWLDETESLPYGEARERLCSLPGVGEKVADCVLLYGGGKLEAFPVDVWILKTMARRYGLDGWKPSQVAQFGRAHFGPHAGLAQQFLFGWERRFGKTI